MERLIQPSGRRSLPGRVFDAGDLQSTRIRPGADAPPRSLYLSARNPTSPGATPAAVLVSLTLGEADGGTEIVRAFHVDRRGVWLSCVGWRLVKLEILSLPAGYELSYCWLSSDRGPTAYLAAARFWQVVAAGAASTPIPPGAIAVTPDRAEAGAVWRQTDAATVYDIPANLAAGTETLIRGAELVYAAPLGAPLVLSWALELV